MPITINLNELCNQLQPITIAYMTIYIHLQ